MRCWSLFERAGQIQGFELDMCLWNTDAPCGNSQNMKKIFKSQILTPPHTPGACDVSEVWATFRWTNSPNLVTVLPPKTLNTSIYFCKTLMPPFPNICIIGLTFDLLTWISIGIIYSSRSIYLLSLKLLGQSVLELSVAQGLGDWHDLWTWPLTY